MHLLAKEKLESDLKQQWQAVREKQYRELQTLQEELKEAHAEAAAKAHSQCLQEKPFLQRQRSEPPVSMLGRRESGELERKAQAWEAAAERHASRLRHNHCTESQWSHKELVQQAQQSWEVQATQSHLHNQKQNLQQEQWSTECFIQGRKQCSNRVIQRPLECLPAAPHQG